MLPSLKLSAARGFRVLVNAGPGEETLGESIVKETGAAAAASVLAGSAHRSHSPRGSLAIAGDTGPLHLACALGRPVVGIYGPTDPSRNGPYGTRFNVLRSPVSRATMPAARQPEAGLLTIQPGRSAAWRPKSCSDRRVQSMSSPSTPPKVRPTQSAVEKIARRIRVPLGFVAAALYLFELWPARRPCQPQSPGAFSSCSPVSGCAVTPPAT